MGQEPNLSHGVEDLPRATPKPAAPRRWVPQRPGDLGSPSEMPWGGAFGTPGPDTGFAIKIIKGRDLPGGSAARGDIERAVIAVVSARASAAGRAPTAADVEVAIDLLGLSDQSIVDGLKGIARDHSRLEELVESIDRTALTRT